MALYNFLFFYHLHHISSYSFISITNSEQQKKDQIKKNYKSKKIVIIDDSFQMLIKNIKMNI